MLASGGERRHDRSQGESDGQEGQGRALSFIGNGKAIALGDSKGLVKTVFDADTGELLGAHMIGAEVTELIQGYTIAMTGELTDADLAHTIFPHPTLSEMMHEAVLDADNAGVAYLKNHGLITGRKSGRQLFLADDTVSAGVRAARPCP